MNSEGSRALRGLKKKKGGGGGFPACARSYWPGCQTVRLATRKPCVSTAWCVRRTAMLSSKKQRRPIILPWLFGPFSLRSTIPTHGPPVRGQRSRAELVRCRFFDIRNYFLGPCAVESRCVLMYSRNLSSARARSFFVGVSATSNSGRVVAL